jgi:peptidyl-tRNA hydrolase
MNPRLYIVVREDIADLNPGKMAAQTAHAQADFDHYISSNCNNDVDIDDCLCEAVSKWKEERNFGVTLVLSATLENINQIKQQIVYADCVVDPTYPWRNWYGKTFVTDEITCLWAFVWTDQEIDYMRQWPLHQ